MGKTVTVRAGSEELIAYEAMPKGEVRGGVLVIHEVWGLAPHIKDVADRLAAEGYLALAPELLAGTMDIAAAAGLQEDLFNPETRNATQPKLRELMAPTMNPEFGDATLRRVRAVFDHLYAKPETGKRVAVIGFCFGGTYAFSLAAAEPRLKLALPFYGHSDQPARDLARIACPMRAFYGEHDERLIGALPDLKKKMAEAKADFQATVYPDCGHAFFNDTNRYSYNQPAAQAAWQASLAALKTALSA